MAARRGCQLGILLCCVLIAGCASTSATDSALAAPQTAAQSSSTSSVETSLAPESTAPSTSDVVEEKSALLAEDLVARPCDEVPDVEASRLGGLGILRNDDDATGGAVNRLAEEHPDTFAGRWIDRNWGTFVVAFTDDVEARRADLDERLNEERRRVVEVVEVEYSLETLNSTVSALRGAGRSIGAPDSIRADITKNRTSAFFLDWEPDELRTAIAQLPEWACYRVQNTTAPPDLAANPGEQLEPVDVRLDPDRLPEPDSVEVHVVLTEVQCAAGAPMGDRLRGPFVSETAGSVNINYWVVAQSAQVCRDRHETAVSIVLSEPVGERTILSGSRELRSPEKIAANHYLNTSVAVLGQVRSLGYTEFPVTELSPTSQVFSIGRDGVEEFAVRIALGRPRETGAWITCGGDYTIEVLSLAGDAVAAEALLESLAGAVSGC